MNARARTGGLPTGEGRIDGMEGFVREALSMLRGKAGVVVVAAPTVPLETFLRIMPAEDAFLWSAPEDPGCAGSGAAVEIAASGADRFSEVRRQAAGLFRELATVDAGPFPARPPRLFGGFSFSAGSAAAPPWDSFGDARFVLPRWLYSRQASGGRLALAFAAADPDELRQSLAARLPDVLDRLARPILPIPATPHPARGARRSRATSWEPDGRPKGRPRADQAFRRMSPAEWSTLVEGAQRRIREGGFAKAVLAQCAVAEIDHPIDPADVLERFDSAGTRQWRFAFRRDGRTFLGLSPERLLSRSGRSVDADAMAGTTAPGALEERGGTERRVGSPTGGRRADQGRIDGARKLLASRKDRAEHAWVVRGLEASLAPFCVRITHARRPEVRRLPHLMHLHTPISGTLDRDTHVLDLVEAVHPTPAVGGTPRQAALSWLREAEPEPRGWYAGPVGWFDENGDGEFAVAIRSCLLEPSRIYAYAGAGIVRASRAELESAEVDLKLRGLLQALGVLA